MKEKRKFNPQDGGERGNDSKAALLLQERKKIIYNLVLLLTASFAVLIGILTMAWFTNNTKVNGTNMSVTALAPKGIQISLGKKSGNYLISTNNAVQDPTVTLSDADWMDEAVDISAYYRFGKLMPASSTTGKDIFYTTDTRESGKSLNTGASIHLATAADGKAATSYILSASDGDEDFWEDYVAHTSWQDVNDDGYFVDIPIWFRTESGNAPISLKVEGCVGPKVGEIVADANNATVDALYKSVRVALLRVSGIENGQEVLVPAAGTNNVIPLRNSKTLDGGGSSILDSGHYLNRKSLATGYYAISVNNFTEPHSLQESVDNNDYSSYTPYSSSEVVSLTSASGTWSISSKYYVRIWIDGDDKDCWNETAGQGWCISLRFTKIESNGD